ncbi:MAG TPA: hypothetical protein VJB08_01735 [Candidatus Nanoarchaeia archaeon]|nr:hypothetical protein [Candidatus Nanoarchaeia archaeon]
MSKAVIDIQLNWIFIIIVGGIILLFFFTLASKQKDVAETKIARTVRFDLSSIFTSSKVTAGSASLISIPNIGISYDCAGYSIGGINPVKPQVAFSPSLFKGYQLMAWTLDWSMPFRIANFQYITSPNVRYIIVDDGASTTVQSKADKIYNLLPEQYIQERGERKPLLAKELVTDATALNNIQNLNNYKVRIVYFTVPPSPLPSIPPALVSMEDEDLTALFIDGEIEGAGEIKFYQKSSTGWAQDAGIENPSATTYYLGTPSLLGAIFSDDIDTYNCNMREAYKVLDKVAEIYKERTSSLKTAMTTATRTNCATELGNAENKLTTIIAANKNLIGVTAPQGTGNLGTIKSEADGLKSTNTNLQRLSCPEVY